MELPRRTIPVLLLMGLLGGLWWGLRSRKTPAVAEPPPVTVTTTVNKKGSRPSLPSAPPAPESPPADPTGKVDGTRPPPPP